MRKSGVLVLVFVVVPAIAGVLSRSAFKYEAPLEQAGAGSQGFARVTLPSEVQARATSDLRDIRLVDDHGTEIGYQLQAANPRSREHLVPARLLNRGVDPGNRFQQLVCDLGSQPAVTNQIRIQTPDRDFVRRIDVLGSADSVGWVTLRKSAYIFDQPGLHPLQNFIVIYPDSSYRYLKLVIWLDRNPVLDVAGVEVVNNIQAEIKPETLSASIDGRREDPQRKVTDLSVDVSLANQHLEQCLLDVEQENFQRVVTVWYQDSRGVWVESGREVIYRLKFGSVVEERLAIPLQEVNERRLRIRISNEDSPPLDVSSVRFRRMPRLLIFTPAAGRSYHLVFGNSDAGRPSYDLGGIVGRLEVARMAAWRVGDVKQNASYVAMPQQQPWTERHPRLVWLIVGFGVLLLGALILHTIRDLKT